MKACHTCGFYNDGWCTLRNQGQNPGGSCSSWSGRGPVKGTKSTRKHAPRTKRATLACGNCIWRKKGKCMNTNSQAYGKYMTSGALCTAFENSEGYILSNDEERCRKLLGRRDNDPTWRSDGSLTPVKKAKTSPLHDYYKHLTCGTCIWRKNRKCTNRESDNYEAAVDIGGFCLSYENKSGYKISKIKTNDTIPASNEESKKKKQENEKTKASEKRITQVKAKYQSEKTSSQTSVRETKRDHCNRCKYLGNNGICQNKHSSSYGKKVHKLSLCKYYRFWQE